MAGGSGGGDSLGEALAALLLLVFSLTFPLVLTTLCGVSYVLWSALHAPELALWAVLAAAAIGYAKTNIWAAIGLIVFALAALPLAWVAYREQQVRASHTILAWLIAIMAISGMFWLRTAWPYDGSSWQSIVYAIIMFGGWTTLIEAGIATLGIVAHVRASRPVPAQPPRQQPHGARDRPGKSDEPDTI